MSGTESDCLSPGGTGARTTASPRRATRNLDHAEMSDVELLLDGAFAPLRGFLGAEDVAAVRTRGRLADGTPWPEPITLRVGPEAAEAEEIELRDGEGSPVAILRNEAPWSEGGHHCAGGPVRATGEPAGALRGLRPPAAEVRGRAGGGSVLALLTGQPLHHRELAQIRELADARSAHVLVLVRMAGPRPELLVQAVLAARPQLPEGSTIVPVPLVRRGDPARDALLTAHVAAAYGATHLITDQAPGQSPVEPVEPPAVVRDAEDRWRPAAEVPPQRRRPELGGEQVRELLDRGDPLPSWFTTPAIAEQQRRLHPPLRERGFTVLFTGLSGAGKSTLARALREELSRHDHRAVTLLDGDVVRRTLCAGLGFSAEDRSRNVQRIGYVAAEVTRHGGTAICAPIAPYRHDREAVRRMVCEVGGFVLVYVATPLSECERRDRKGLYREARTGALPEFTGVSAPYEVPEDADLVLDTSVLDRDAAVARVVALLRERGWVRPWTSG